MLVIGGRHKQHAIWSSKNSERIFDGFPPARRGNRAGKHGPGRGHRAHRINGATVVGEVADIAIAGPAFVQRAAQLRRSLAIARRTRDIAAHLEEGRDIEQDPVQEETEPDAFASSLNPDKMHAVIPVARPDERQTMRAETIEGVVDRARAMSQQRVAIARNKRHRRIAFLIVRHRIRFEEWFDGIENACVAGALYVTNRDIGQPEMRIG